MIKTMIKTGAEIIEANGKANIWIGLGGGGGGQCGGGGNGGGGNQQLGVHSGLLNFSSQCVPPAFMCLLIVWRS